MLPNRSKVKPFAPLFRHKKGVVNQQLTTPKMLLKNNDLFGFWTLV
jgi:hypothetical protein